MKARKFEVILTIQTVFPVTPEVVQEAALRAVATTFNIAGSCQINVRPLGICPCRGCEERVPGLGLSRKRFLCGAHFKMLPPRMQAVLREGGQLNAKELRSTKDVLVSAILACIGFVAQTEGKGNTRDELAAMAMFEPMFEPAATQAGTT